MPDLSVYAQAKLLNKLLNPPHNEINDFVEIVGLYLRIDSAYDLTEDEAEIVKMLVPDRPEGELLF